MKKVLFMLIFLVFSVSFCYASPQEVIAEGTYVMTNNDTPTVAEEAALIAAKRAALEQAGTFIMSSTSVRDMKLVDDQIRSLSVGVIEATVLEKKKYYNGDSLIFWCKIKANVSTDKLAEAIEKGFRSLDKPVMGVVLLIDNTLPKKNDLALFFKPKMYTITQFSQDYRISDGIKNAVSEKYSSRSLSVESGENINKLFLNIAEKYSDLLETARANNYEYLLIATQKVNCIDRSTFSWFYTTTFTATVKADCDIKVIDIRNNKTIFKETVPCEGIGRASDLDESLNIATRNYSIELGNRLQKVLPQIPLN